MHDFADQNLVEMEGGRGSNHLFTGLFFTRRKKSRENEVNLLKLKIHIPFKRNADKPHLVLRTKINNTFHL